MIRQTGEDRESKSLQGRAGQRGRKKNPISAVPLRQRKERLKKEQVGGRRPPMSAGLRQCFLTH